MNVGEPQNALWNSGGTESVVGSLLEESKSFETSWQRGEEGGFLLKRGDEKSCFDKLKEISKHQMV